MVQLYTGHLGLVYTNDIFIHSPLDSPGHMSGLLPVQESAEGLEKISTHNPQECKVLIVG